MNTQTTVKSVDLEKFLVRASAIIKALGYVSNSDVKGTDKKSTAQLALDWADDIKPKEIMAIAFDWDDKQTSREVVEWLGQENLGKKVITTAKYQGEVWCAPALCDEYLVKLFFIGKSGIVTDKTAGYAASAIGAMAREKAKGEDTKKGLEEFSAAFGVVGAKIQGIKVIFIGKSQFDSRFGLCHKYEFADSMARKITWMTSTELTALVQGNAYTLEGTIKDYSTYKGKHECQITRAKVKG